MRKSSRIVGGLACLVSTLAACSGGDPTERSSVTREAVSGTPFFYLRCNSTDWGVDEGSRLKPTSDPNVFTLTVSPHNAGNDPCSVTETIASGPDQWGNAQVFFVTPNRWTLQVPGSSPLVALSPQGVFNVQYPSAGTYVATYNAAQNTLAVAPSGTVSGRVTQAPGAGVAGTIVSLKGPSGATMATTATDANGSYKFSGIAPGTYSLGLATTTANVPQPSYAPASAPVTVLGAAVVQNVACTAAANAPCTVGPTVNDPFHQLLIVDPAVTDPAQDARASNATDGHLSFRYVMETLAGTCPGLSQAVCTSNFVRSWMTALSTDVVNTFPQAGRNTANLVNFFWPKLADGQTLDMAQAPFQLLAVVNRTDLHSTGQGEGRLVYGIKIPGFEPTGNSMTVIFEFALPSTSTSPNRLGWVNQFFSLPNNGSKSCQFACASAPNPVGCALACNVQALTDQFVQPSLLLDLRTNEQFLAPGDGSWAWRQFLISTSGSVNQIVVSPVPETPDNSLNNANPLASFVKTNEGDIENGFISLPLAIGSSPVLGSVAFEGTPKWAFPSVGLDEAGRHAFSGRTCNGCHFFEAASAQGAGISTLPLDGFFHISPLRNHDATGQNLVSPFLSQIEIPRRASFMSNQLGCGSANCAAGVDVALMQP